MKAPGQGNDKKPIHVLLVDDDADDHVFMRDLFADMADLSLQLDWAATYDAGLEWACRGEHGVYLIDYRLGVLTGLDLLREVRARRPDAVIILLTGKGERAIDISAMELGADDYLEKERLDAVVLERSIRYGLLQKKYEAKLEQQVKERTRELEQVNTSLQREIADRRRAEEALLQADRRKDQFLATLAHELRNPLAPIRHSVEIIRLSGSDLGSIRQSCALMERQVNQLVRLIDDLLDVSRITRGKLRLVKEPLTLKQIIDAALEISGPVIERAGLKLHVKVCKQEVSIEGDLLRLSQAISNLLNNAAKYTEPGGKVWLTAEATASTITISVRDNGMGITADLLPQLFDFFIQADRTLPHAQGGLGVGLGLVRTFVEMHGGTVVAHSDGPNQGAEFTVRLPRSGTKRASPVA